MGIGIVPYLHSGVVEFQLSDVKKLSQAFVDADLS